MLVETIEQPRSLEGNLQLQEREIESSPMLVSLPVELQTKILMSSTWRDILHVRLTCKWLLEVTKSRAIWAHLVKEHISTDPYPPHLERPIDMHTSDELEHLLLLWKSADIAMEGASITHVCERTFYLKRPKASSYLVRGGRWLLVVDHGGAVLYYDLDAEKITGRALIPKLVDPYCENKIFMSVDYDVQSPILKFTIAMFLSEENPKHRSSGRFRIWSVSLSLDSSNRGVGLVGTRLAMFPMHGLLMNIFSLSILGPHLAFTAFNRESHQIHVFLVRWEHANGRSNIYPLRMFQQIVHSAVVHLLPGSRLLVFFSRTVRLYDYATTQEAVGALVTSHPLCLWDEIFNQFIRRNSNRLTTPTATRFMLNVRETVLAIDIQNDPVLNGIPTVTRIADSAFEFATSVPYLGYFRAIALGDNQNAELLQYPSEYCPEVPISTNLFSFKLPIPFGHILMDEHTGRIVIPNVALHNQSAVIDLALSYERS